MMKSNKKILIALFIVAVFSTALILNSLIPNWSDEFIFWKKESHMMEVKNADYWLGIDKLKIQVPVAENVNGTDKAEYDRVLLTSLAHYKGTALPGNTGNVFIFGHSSNDQKGKLNDVFAGLDKLTKNDKIKIYYHGITYSYSVSEKRVVEAKETSVLEQGQDKKLTLMTCWPVGTTDKRLIVTATQD